MKVLYSFVEIVVLQDPARGVAREYGSQVAGRLLRRRDPLGRMETSARCLTLTVSTDERESTSGIFGTLETTTNDDDDDDRPGPDNDIATHRQP